MLNRLRALWKRCCNCGQRTMKWFSDERQYRCQTCRARLKPITREAFNEHRKNVPRC
jgi:hypothetical protein